MRVNFSIVPEYVRMEECTWVVMLGVALARGWACEWGTRLGRMELTRPRRSRISILAELGQTYGTIRSEVRKGFRTVEQTFPTRPEGQSQAMH